MTPADLRKAIDAGHPTLIALQAYRNDEIIAPYKDLWTEGHWVVNIGYEDDRLIFEDPASFHRTWLRDGELCERWHDTMATGNEEDSRLGLHALGQWYLQARTARAHGLN